eukprot:12559611-Alexandrium_andersonii.AAC.1
MPLRQQLHQPSQVQQHQHLHRQEQQHWHKQQQQHIIAIPSIVLECMRLHPRSKGDKCFAEQR